MSLSDERRVVEATIRGVIREHPYRLTGGWLLTSRLEDAILPLLEAAQQTIARLTLERDNWQSRAAERDAECERRFRAQHDAEALLGVSAYTDRQLFDAVSHACFVSQDSMRALVIDTPELRIFLSDLSPQGKTDE